MSETRLAWVAGELSGDQIAAPVIEHIRQASGRGAIGIGGPAMQAAGLDAYWTIDDLSVRGYAEVLQALPRLLSMRKALRQRIETIQPACFIGVDAPDFNLGLETRLRQNGVKTMHFIGPSVWAWRRNRLKGIAKAVDHMLLIFPFEKKLYDAAGIDATYVGHPMADAIDPTTIDRTRARTQLGLALDRPVVALLPGSRPSEIKYMGELFFRTASWLCKRRQDLQFVVPAANPRLFERLSKMATQLGLEGVVDLTIVDGEAAKSISAADTVLVASGTASLETALHLRPMVIAYRMSPISYQIMRRMAYLPWVGLPNILCEDWVVPELVQDAATPASLGIALLEQLDGDQLRERIVSRFSDLHQRLAMGCAQRASEVILNHV